FRAFASAIERGGCVAGFAAPGAGTWSRKELDALVPEATARGATGLVWIALEGGQARSPVLSHISPEEIAAVSEATGAGAGDIVLNGIELGSGSVRIHRPDLQRRVFEVMGITGEEATDKFGHMLEAFRFGVPPHAGFAFGLDRVLMLLSGKENIRDVIAFPKTSSGSELLTGAPSEPSQEQLDQLGMRFGPLGR